MVKKKKETSFKKPELLMDYSHVMSICQIEAIDKGYKIFSGSFDGVEFTEVAFEKDFLYSKEDNSVLIGKSVYGTDRIKSANTILKNMGFKDVLYWQTDKKDFPILVVEDVFGKMGVLLAPRVDSTSGKFIFTIKEMISKKKKKR